MILKRIHWFFGALLMMVFLLNSAVTTLAVNENGYIDSADKNLVKGWALSSSDLNTPAQVKVVVTNQSTGQVREEFQVTASEYRADLTANGTLSGNYGFQVTVPFDTYEAGSYLVEAYADGLKLPNTKTYNAGAGAVNLSSLGVFRTTAYCPCRKCSAGWGGRTSTGAMASAGHTIAVDPRVIPYGTRVMINGVIYTAEDRGGAVKGNHIDIFFNTHGETRAYGSRKVEVFLVQ